MPDFHIVYNFSMLSSRLIGHKNGGKGAFFLIVLAMLMVMVLLMVLAMVMVVVL